MAYCDCKKYGKQKMQDVMLQSGRSIKHIFCTANHRWLLNDGSVTTNPGRGYDIGSFARIGKIWIRVKRRLSGMGYRLCNRRWT